MVACLKSRFVRLTLASVISVVALMTPAAGSMAAGPDHPLAPSGYKPDMSGLAVTTEVVTLPPAKCAELNRSLVASGKAAQADCRIIHGSYGFNHRPLPRGTVASSRGLFSSGTALAAAAYYHWSWADYECSIYGCWYWKVSLEEDGVANGSNVWQWDVWCTASGINTYCTWKGYNYNGGGWPYYAMQFGEDSNSCAFINGGPVCIGHGMRRWITDSAALGSFNYW